MKLKFNGSLGMFLLGWLLWTFVIVISFGLLTPLAVYILIEYIINNTEVIK